jgi:hypothetical protein
MSAQAIPEIDPSQTDEQGRALSKPRPSSSSQNALTASPLDLGSVGDIIDASGLGASRHMSKDQNPGMPKLPGAPDEGAGAEGAAGAGDAAAGAGAAEELLPLIALA